MLNKGISTPIAIGIITILVIIVGSFTWWQYGEIEKERNDLPKLEFSEKEVDETADWETYRNEELGFEIKYPKESFFKAEVEDYNEEENFTDKRYITSIFYPENIESDTYVQITIDFSESRDNNYAFERALNLVKNTEGATIEDTTINGIKGINGVEHYQIEKAEGMIITQLFPDVRGRLCRIVLITADYNNDFYQNKGKEILSTFKFLN